MEYLLYSFLVDANKRAGSCCFIISNNNLPIMAQYSVYAFRKNWRYTDLASNKWVNMKVSLNKLITHFTNIYRLLRAWDAGLIDYRVKSNKLNIDKCQPDHIKKTGPKIRPLSLVHLSGPFVILLLGLSISFLVFLVELIISRWKMVRAL